MQTVTSTFTSHYRTKNSRFTGYLCPAASISDTEENLLRIRNSHPRATHHCYAYLIQPNNPVEYYSDDGEPGGTAGLPILNRLKSHSLMNVIAIVVRYYGGTKLGKSGLIDAYQTTTSQLVENATLKNLIPIIIYSIEYDYSKQSLIEKLKNDFSWFELESSYLETVHLKVGCNKTESSKFELVLSEQQHHLIDFKRIGESYHIKN